MERIIIKNNSFVVKDNLYGEEIIEFIKGNGGVVQKKVSDETYCIIADSFSGKRGEKILALENESTRVVLSIPFLFLSGVDVGKTCKKMKINTNYKYACGHYYLYYSRLGEIYKKDVLYKWILEHEETHLNDISSEDNSEAMKRLILVKEYDEEKMIEMGLISKSDFHLIRVMDYWCYVMEDSGANNVLSLLREYINTFDEDSKKGLQDIKEKARNGRDISDNTMYYLNQLRPLPINCTYKQGQHGIYLK